MIDLGKEKMIWDLSQLVDDTKAAWVIKKLEGMVEEALRLRERYYGKIDGLDSGGLLELLQRGDELTLEYEGVTLYCRLIYSANSTDEVAKHLNDSSRTALMKVGQALAFVDIEVGKLLAGNPSLMEEPGLAEYRHYLERLLMRVPYMLSEAEERIAIAKDKNGINAWSQLQGDWLSTRMFEIEVDGVKKRMSYGEIIGLYESPDRELRMMANKIVYEGLGRDEIVWASAVRSVCADHLQMCEFRRYPSPMTQSLVDNDVDQKTLDSLMGTIEGNVGLYRRYLRLKARLMGLKKLANWDITAPLPNIPAKEYTWEESRRIVTESYSSFDEEVGGWIDEMYERRHIDAEPRVGKRSGAFCSRWLSGRSAYILQTFNGMRTDVNTQAHELGHAVHDYLGSRHQRPSNFEIGMCIAECGSNLGELLLTDRLLSTAGSREEKQAILVGVLDGFGMTAFQVSARVFFEQSMYDAIKQGRFLDGETVSRLWVAGRDKIYGDAVEWLPEMKWEWTMKPHYYIPNFRFYNYPYVFAKLFTFALYRLYREQGRTFVPKLKALLAAGSSKSPAQLAAELGFDITTEEFWGKGMRQAEEFIDQLEATL